MKRKVLSIICLLCLICSISSVAAYADSFKSDVGTVWFDTDGNAMHNDFAKNNLTETLYSRLNTLQPGDDVTFVVNLRNDYTKGSNWYMTSEIIDSLEEGTAKGGGYTYQLQYVNNTDSSKSRMLYNSETVGGDPTSGQAQSEQGLREVNQAIKEDYNRNGVSYFYLDNLARGQGGQIVLKIALDGETQGNRYQDRLADLRMNFAVQVQDNTGNTTTTSRGTAPKTGDEHNLLPYYIAMIISGLLFLYFALDAYTDRLYKKGKGKA